MNTSEGCATISDNDGNLLFYTDGLTVWNRQHEVMANGTGLMGNGSTAQAAVAIPAPGNSQRYYIFTNDNNARANGLRYSVVDMTLQAGMGQVTEKNIFLSEPVSEMLTAVRHANGTDIWVIAHDYGNNSFRAFLISAQGISAQPVISQTGQIHTADNSGSNAIGCMKVATDGRRLAVASFAIGAEVYDFDPATGQVSNPIKVTQIVRGYGVEFSPDGSKLYITTSGNTELFQVDLKAGSPAQVAASATLISRIGQDGATRYVGGSLQVGPDLKIYVARPTSQHLGVIENPNALGIACRYTDRGLFLGDGLSMCGLPVFVQSFFNYDYSLQFSNLCFGENTRFSLNAPPLTVPVSVVWDFGDPASGPDNTSTLLAPSHKFSAPGTYTVKLTRTVETTLEEYSSTIVIKPLPAVDLGADRAICPGSSTILDATLPNATAYRWSNGSTQATLQVSQPGTYWVEVTAGGCTARDEVVVTLLPVPQVELGPDRQLCAGETLVLDATTTGVSYLWQDGSTSPTYTVTTAGRYQVTVTNADGCSSTDALEVSYKPLPAVNLGSDRVLCSGEPLVLGSAQPNATYLWQDGSTNATFSPTASGTYWQEVTINGCSARDEVNVTFNPLPLVNLGRDTTLCEGQTLLLDVSRPNATYRWPDGSTEPNFTVSSAGTYWVEVTNEFNCTTRDEVKVHYLTPPTIELGNDTTLCYGDSLVVGQVLPGVTYLWQDGSTQSTITIKKPGTYRLTASLQHCSQTDAITVKFKVCVGGLFIPNIITPNGDGLNDAFFIMGLISTTLEERGERWELTIFDRWGKRLYENKNYLNDWDAQGISEGVYFYHLRHNKDGREFKGWVEVGR